MRVQTDAGVVIELGTTETAPTIGIVDYSRRVTDDFGVTTVVERGFARRMTVRLAVPFDGVDALQATLAALRATPALWTADDTIHHLQMRGFYKDFSVDLNVPPISYCTLTVEGLAASELVTDTGTDPAPEGQTSTLQLLDPVTITDAMLGNSDVPENDHPQWNAGTTYAAGARVRTVTHRICESLVAGNLGNDPTSTSGNWLDVGPVNRWAMFDQALGTATTNPGDIYVILQPGSVDAVALLDVVGANVRVEAAGYNTVKPVVNGVVTFLDLPLTNGQVFVTLLGSGTVKIGTLLLGKRRALGVTEASPTAGITDYSRKDVDEFGEVTVVERAWAKRMTARALIRTTSVDDVASRLAAVRARPVLWIGQAGLNSLTVYGFFKEFSIEPGPSVSWLSLSIEGLSKAAPIAAAPVVLSPRGTYNPAATYAEGDVVQYQGSSWSFIASQAATGQAPPSLPIEENAWWRVFAAAGGDGADGTNGTNGLTIAEIQIFQRAAAQPSTPTGGVYSFTAKSLTTVPAGWSVVPPAGTTPLWSAKATASIQGTTGTATPVWAGVGKIAQDGVAGAAGADGASTDAIFVRSAAQPSTPAASTGTPAGWYTDAASVPASANPLWVSFGQRPNAISNYTWDVPARVEGAAGTNGAAGLSVAEITVYQRAASQPATPTAGAYDFATKVPSGVTAGWSPVVPNGTSPLYAARGTASVQGTTGTAAIVWAGVGKIAQDGTAGTNGTNGTNGSNGTDGAGVDIIFVRSAAQPAAPAASTGIPAGWYADAASVPPSANPLWTSFGQRPNSTSSYTWDTPARVEGSAGLSVAEVTAYQRAASQPATPTGGSYDFGTKVLTPPAGWATTPPAGTAPLYEAKATASVQGTTGATVPTWIGVGKIAQDGASGANGTNGVDGAGVDVVFTRSVAEPATPAASTGAPAGWYTDVASVPASTSPLWSSFGQRPNSTANYTWDTPTRVQGADGSSINLFAPAGTVPVVVDGNRITATANNNSNIFSREVFAGTAIASGRFSGSLGHIVGLALSNAVTTGLVTYAWHRSVNGNWYTYHPAGDYQIMPQGTNGVTLSANTMFSVGYDGGSIIWFADGEIMKVLPVSANLKFYLGAMALSTGSVVSDLSFVPYTDRVWANIIGAGKPANYASRNDDGANMLPAPSDVTTWQFGGGAGLTTLTNYVGLPNGQYAAVEGAGAWAAFGPHVPCQGGQKLFFSYFVGSNYQSGSNAETLNASVRFKHIDGSVTAINLGGPPYNSARKLTEVYGGVMVTASFVVPLTALEVQPYVERPTFTSFSFYANRAYLGRAEAGAEVPHSVAPITDIAVAATPSGTTKSGQLPQVRFVQHIRGSVDVTAISTITATASSGVSITVNNTPGDPLRGTITINNAANLPSEATVSGTSLQGSTVVPFAFKVSRFNDPEPSVPPAPPAGQAGQPASTYQFSPPTSTTYVELGRCAPVTLGGTNNVSITCDLTYYSVDQGYYANGGAPSSGSQMIVLLQYSTDNGASWAGINAGVVGTAAYRYASGAHAYGGNNQLISEYTLDNNNDGSSYYDDPGYVRTNFSGVGGAAGTQALIRVMGAVHSGPGILAVEGSMIVTPS